MSDSGRENIKPKKERRDRGREGGKKRGRKGRGKKQTNQKVSRKERKREVKRNCRKTGFAEIKGYLGLGKCTLRQKLEFEVQK